MRRTKTHVKMILLGLILSVTACDSNRVYEDYVDFEGVFWHVDDHQRFEFQIEDQAETYNVYATFRNSSGYPYYNLFFQYRLLDSTDRVIKSELKEVDLFDPKTGKPLGEGLGDLFDHQTMIDPGLTFDQPGTYTIEFQQYMRMDTLPFLLSVGARVERASD